MNANTPTRQRLIVSFALIILLIGCGTGIAGLLYITRVEPPHRDITVLPPLVETILLESEDITEQFVGYATAQPDRSANIASEVSGLVVERADNIKAGSIVEENQILIRLDNRSYKHALEQAEAKAAADQASIAELAAEARKLDQLLGTAEKELSVAAREKKRLSDLLEKGRAAKKEFDFADLAFRQTERTLQEYQMQMARIGPRRDGFFASIQGHVAEAEIAKLDIERCVIRAPFGGTIDAMFVEVGDHLVPGGPVLRLVDTTRVEIPIRLPASVHARVAVGAICDVAPEGMPGVSWQGRVARIAPLADSQTRTFAVYVEIDNEEQPHALLPGMFVKAVVKGPTHTQRLLIPRGAIREGMVFIAKGKTAVQRSVQVERLFEDRALVAGDVQPGELVILSHLGQLKNSAAIRLFGSELHPGNVGALSSGRTDGASSLP